MTDYVFKTDYPELEALYDFPSKAIADVGSVNFVVTHGNCADGFMSRVVVEKEMRENPDRFNTPLEEVEFVNCSYGQDFSDLPERMRGKTVLICDFSFKPYLFNQMIEATGGNILVLDHHATAQSNFTDIEPKFAVFDMKHSGAFITQVFVHGFQNVPKAVLYVEDNDIWNKALPNTLEFTAFMFLQEFEYDSYVELFNNEFVQETAIPIGVGAVLQNQAHIDNILGRTKVSFMEVKGRHYFVANVNCAGILRSELGNQALKKFTRANFAFCYTQNLKYGGTSISLRSMDDRTDASYVAGLFGGGGHRNASGMGVSTLETHMPGRTLDEYRAYDLLEYVYAQKVGNSRYLVLNTPAMKTAFVKYLMQERYVGERDSAKNQVRYDGDLPGYQEGMFVMRENSGEADLDEAYNGAICWNYDGNSNQYFVTLAALKTDADAVRRFMERSVEVYGNVSENENAETPTFQYSENKGVFYASFDATLTYRSPSEFIQTLGESMI
jgi:oligoribonuclease NrnB/cAMP/cGMP phosphodiesterase (DHH superfamily)